MEKGSKDSNISKTDLRNSSSMFLFKVYVMITVLRKTVDVCSEIYVL